ncbi:Eco57I restriction-modification methylase domain-containing protein, partial [Brachyspira hampsonii]
NHQYLNYFDKKDSKVSDIYQLFMEMSFNRLIDESGIVSAVVSNKWMRAGYGERTRKFLYDRAYVYEVIDLGANWFESATVDTNIISYGKRKEDIQEKINAYKISLCDDIFKSKKDKLSGVEKECFIYPKKDNSSWIILNEDEKSILEKIHRFKALKDWGIKINFGIKTGFNEAFFIDEETKNNLIKEDAKSAELIKPLIRGRNIAKYYSIVKEYLINIHNGIKEKDIPPINIKDYPAIKRHLDKYYKQLEKRQDKGDTPYNLRNCAYLEDFEEAKIAWGNISSESRFCYLFKDFFVSAPANILTINSKDENILKYLLAVMNSKVFNYQFTNFGITLGHAYEWKKQYVEPLKIPEPDKDTENKLVNLVDDIIRLKKENKDASGLEAEVDKIVYSLYGLTDEEIKIIEGE